MRNQLKNILGLMVFVFFGFSSFVKAQGNEISWSSFNNKMLVADESDDDCPSSLFNFSEEGNDFLIRIGPRHSFEWTNVKKTDVESAPRTCTETTTILGTMSRLKSITVRTNCPEKNFSGAEEEALSIVDAQTLLYLHNRKDGQGKIQSKHRCTLRVQKEDLSK